MLQDQTTVKGKVIFVLTGPDGKVKEKREHDNVVTTLGKGFLALRAKDDLTTVMSHMEVGTGGTAAAGDTTLETAVGSSRTALTSTTISTNTITYACTFGAGTGTGALVEAGIFNDATTGTMLCRTVYSVINKGAADTLTISWVITIS